MDKIPDIVDLVLYFLALLSMVTWAILLHKLYIFWRLKKVNSIFSRDVSGLSKLSQLPIASQSYQGTLSCLHEAALHTLKSWAHDAHLDKETYTELLAQVLKKEQHQQQTKLESGLAVLASVGSTAPFIGLFGTVWGIMHALKGISATGSAGLDVVAGPIGEALIATAMGIAAAIPAVLAYNFLLRRVRLAAVDMSHFSERLQTLAKRASFRIE